MVSADEYSPKLASFVNESIDQILGDDKLRDEIDEGAEAPSSQEYLPGESEGAADASTDETAPGSMSVRRSVSAQILSDFDTFCKDNSIHYFVTSDTLLGVTLFGDYLPDTASITIGLLWADYERLDALAQKAVGDGAVSFPISPRLKLLLRNRVGDSVVRRKTPVLSNYEAAGTDSSFDAFGLSQSGFDPPCEVKIAVFNKVPDDLQLRFDHISQLHRLAANDDPSIFDAARQFEDDDCRDVMCVLGEEDIAVPLSSLSALRRGFFHGVETWVPNGKTPWDEYASSGYAHPGRIDELLVEGGRSDILDCQGSGDLSSRSFSWFCESAKVAVRRSECVRLLSVFDRLCEAIGVRYFLIGDTLRGAVSKGGFLPGASRVEVGMLAESFFKICEHFAPSGSVAVDGELGDGGSPVEYDDTLSLVDGSTNVRRRVLLFSSFQGIPVLYNGVQLYNNKSKPLVVNAQIEISLFSSLPDGAQERLDYLGESWRLNREFERSLTPQLKMNVFDRLVLLARRYEEEPTKDVGRVLGNRSVAIPRASLDNLRRTSFEGIQTWAPSSGGPWDQVSTLASSGEAADSLVETLQGMLLTKEKAQFVVDTLGFEDVASRLYSLWCRAQRIVFKRDALGSLLRELDTYCNKSGVKYFLFSESLRGANSRGDFTLGSDSIQIGMLWDEFCTLRKSINDRNVIDGSSVPWVFSLFQEDDSRLRRRLPVVRFAFRRAFPIYGKNLPRSLSPQIEISLFTAIPDNKSVRKRYFQVLSGLNRAYEKKLSNRQITSKGLQGIAKKTILSLTSKSSLLDTLFSAATYYESKQMTGVARVLGKRSKTVTIKQLGDYRRVSFHGVESWAPQYSTAWERETFNDLISKETGELLRNEEVQKDIQEEILGDISASDIQVPSDATVAEDISGTLCDEAVQRQDATAQLLGAFTAFCESEGLSYFLISKVLTGAQVQNDFLLDSAVAEIGMLWPDYVRLRELVAQRRSAGQWIALMDGLFLSLQFTDGDDTSYYRYKPILSNYDLSDGEPGKNELEAPVCPPCVRITASVFCAIPDDVAMRRAYIDAVVEAEKHAKLRAAAPDAKPLRDEVFAVASSYEGSSCSYVMCALGSRGQFVLRSSVERTQQRLFHGINVMIPAGPTPWDLPKGGLYASRDSIAELLHDGGHDLILSCQGKNKLAAKAFGWFKDAARISCRRDAEAALLQVFNDLCLEIGARYFLIGNTCRGAVAIGDFLPGRSRIEVGMLWDSFSKLRTYAIQFERNRPADAAEGKDGSEARADRKEFEFSVAQDSKGMVPRRVIVFRKAKKIQVTFDGLTIFDSVPLPIETSVFIEISLFTGVPDDPKDRVVYLERMARLNALFEKSSKGNAQRAYEVLISAARQYDDGRSKEVARVVGNRSVLIPRDSVAIPRAVEFHRTHSFVPSGETPWHYNNETVAPPTDEFAVDNDVLGLTWLSDKEARLVKVVFGEGAMRSWEYEAYRKAVITWSCRDVLSRLLREFDAYCGQHGIHYFLFADSLQGAVAYQGFIPGAERIQIGMLYSDYVKLAAACGGSDLICEGDLPWILSVETGTEVRTLRRFPLIRPAFPVPVSVRGEGIAHTVNPKIELSIFTAIPDDYLTRKALFKATDGLNRAFEKKTQNKSITSKGLEGKIKKTLFANMSKEQLLDKLFDAASYYEGKGMRGCARLLGSRTKPVLYSQIGSYRPVLFNGVSTWGPELETAWEGEPLDEPTPELRELQNAAKEIVSEIHRVCKQLGVSYFVCGGTMLGYMRHGGFIPWDDDIDVGMLRSDYEVFKANAGSIIDTDKFFFQTRESDPKIPYLFSKVRMNNTTYITEYNQYRDFHKGICVDIFPFDAIPNDIGELKRFKNEVRAVEVRHNKTVNNQYPMATLIKEKGSKLDIPTYIASHVVGDAVSARYWSVSLKDTQRDYDQTVQRYNAVADELGLEYVASFVPSYTMVRLSDVFPIQEVEFEGITICMIANPHAFLRMQYGLYMLMPEPHQRVGHPLLEWKTNAASNGNEGNDLESR